MIEFLDTVNQYHWLSFACVLVIFEIFGAAGFMLGFSLAAFVIFLIMSFVDISWQIQILIFAGISLVSSICWYIYQFKKDKENEKTTTLNKKENQLIGQKVTLSEDIEAGKGRLKVTDSTWPVYTEENLKAGDIVEITKVNGIFLHIQKVK